jgi:uncharacterized protein YndB with AHSA1/START domain
MISGQFIGAPIAVGSAMGRGLLQSSVGFKGVAMAHFACEVLLKASPQDVYRALTTAVGLRSWFTATCDVSEAVGGECTFRFGSSLKVMRVEELVPARLVRWRCTAHVPASAGPQKSAASWSGSSITFRIEPDRDGARLRFLHEGLQATQGESLGCERVWGHFLGRSLKHYVETAIGEPYGSRLAPLQMIA